MALKIYGVARSRAFRTLWMAKELGLDYEHIKVDFATGETRAPEHFALNPNGHVPVIDDDGFILWELMAINLYLAKKYGRDGIYPIAARGRGAGLAMELLGDDRGRAAGADCALQPRDFARESARCCRGGRCREVARPAARGARRRARPQPEPARGSLHRRRPQCRQHSRLGAPGADRHVRRSRRSPSGSRTAPSGRRRARPASCSGNEEAMAVAQSAGCPPANRAASEVGGLSCAPTPP